MILLPTLNRTALLKDFFASYRETNAEVPVMVLVDDNDYIANSDEYESIKFTLPAGCKIIQTGTAVSMGDKVRFVWPVILKLAPSWVGILNDDHYCITKEWDKKAAALLDGTNMVSTNDGYWNFGFNIVGLTAWSMPLIECAGFPIFPPGLDHWFIDNLWKAIGESTGCWHETMAINIEHRHAFLGKMEKDSTFNVSQNQSSANSGRAVFEQFMQNDFSNLCMKIMKWRQELVEKEIYI